MDFNDFRNKKKDISYELPVFTLDLNTISVKDRSEWCANQTGLNPLEYNYFYKKNVELCVTPEAPIEIAQGQSLECLGTFAYQRIKKSDLFKTRPTGTTLELVDEEPNVLWMDIRGILFPSVSDVKLNENQKADITHMFYHCTASGSLESSAYLTLDKNFHRHAGDFDDKFGIRVMYPTQAWNYYRKPYSLYQPSDVEIQEYLREHSNYLNDLMLKR